jgi:hypothetical protein
MYKKQKPMKIGIRRFKTILLKSVETNTYPSISPQVCLLILRDLEKYVPSRNPKDAKFLNYKVEDLRK